MVRLHRRVHAAVDVDDPDWEPIYQFVFAEYRESEVRLEYYDPDTSYKDDVLAFVEALDRYAAPYLRAEATE